MKSTIFFLVEVEDSYNNHIELEDGTELSVNNSIDSVEHINRVGKVIDAPRGTVVSEEDFLLFHHNICRMSWGLKSKKRKSVFSVTDNIFYIPTTEIFMYMKKGENFWNALDPYTFVKPIPVEDIELPNGLIIKEEDYKGMKPLVGEVTYPNKSLLKQGVNKGDIIAFQEYSEHEYSIKGEIHYKMKTQDILAVL